MAKKKGAPEAGLYFKCKLSEYDDLFPKIRQVFFVINRSEYEKNMHAFEIEVDQDDHKNLPEFIKLIQDQGGVVLLLNETNLAHQHGADGVLLEDLKDYEAARQFLSDDDIVGLDCGTDQEKALEALDAGIDFVSFSSEGEAALCLMWSSKTEKPCVVSGGLNNENAASFVQAGATFIESSDYIFNNPKDVMQGTVNMLYAIEQTNMSRAVN